MTYPKILSLYGLVFRANPSISSRLSHVLIFVISTICRAWNWSIFDNLVLWAVGAVSIDYGIYVSLTYPWETGSFEEISKK